MAYTPVGVGTVANDNTGDPIRTAFQSINANFVILDGLLPDTATLTITGNDLLGTAVNTDVDISANGTGNVVIGSDLVLGANSLVSVAAADITITPDTTGSIVLDGLNWPQADGTANYVLETDGAAQLQWVQVATAAQGALADSAMQFVTATTAELTAVGNAINTAAAKVQGYQVYNTTTDAPVWAAGAADADVWNDATGTLAHTPV